MNVILPSILLPINEKYINKMIFEEQTVGGRKEEGDKSPYYEGFSHLVRYLCATLWIDFSSYIIPTLFRLSRQSEHTQLHFGR